MRTSESPSVTSVMTSATVRASRAAAVGALSRIDHHTSVAEPGVSVASTTVVRPAAVRARDETRRQVDVGLFARQVDRRAHGAGRRHRQRERRAAGRERERRAPLERERERTGPRQQRRVRVPVGDRAAAAGRPRRGVHERRAGEQADACHAGTQDVAGHIERAARGVAVDAHPQVGARQHGRHGRRGRRLRRPSRRDRSAGCIRSPRASPSAATRRAAAAAVRRPRCAQRRRTPAVNVVGSVSLVIVTPLPCPLEGELDGWSAGFGGQLGRQEDAMVRTPGTRREPAATRRPSAAAGFVPESIDERLQARGRAIAVAACRAAGGVDGAGGAPPRTDPDRSRRGTIRSAARPGSAAGSAARPPSATPAGRAPADRRVRVPCRASGSRPALQVDQLDDERRRLFAGAALLERQQHRVGLGHGRTNRPARDLRAPQRRPGRHRHLEEAALVVAHGVSRLDEQPAVFETSAR